MGSKGANTAVKGWGKSKPHLHPFFIPKKEIKDLHREYV